MALDAFGYASITFLRCGCRDDDFRVCLLALLGGQFAQFFHTVEQTTHAGAPQDGGPSFLGFD